LNSIFSSAESRFVQLSAFQLPSTTNAIFYVPTIETWQFDRIFSPKPDPDVSHAQTQSSAAGEEDDAASPLLQELRPATDSSLFSASQHNGAPGEEIVDVEFWDSPGGDQSAAVQGRRSFEVDVVGAGAGQDDHDLEHICPSFFGRSGEGDAHSTGECSLIASDYVFFSTVLHYGYEDDQSSLSVHSHSAVSKTNTSLNNKLVCQSLL
jgi:hypothetical protein